MCKHNYHHTSDAYVLVIDPLSDLTGWIHFLQLDYEKALTCYVKLKNETRWSACYYAYLSASRCLSVSLCVSTKPVTRVVLAGRRERGREERERRVVL